MKLVQILIVLILIVELINFVRAGEAFHIARVLPFCGGHKPGFYDVAGLLMLLITVWGLGRLGRSGKGEE